MDKYTVFNARELDFKLNGLPGPYDLIYSLYAIGFHWSLQHFIHEIDELMHRSSITIFTVPKDFEHFPELERFETRIVRWKTVWPKNTHLQMLLLSKSDLPVPT